VYLIRRLGMEVGGCIHAGRSSWDLGGIANRLPLRSGLLEVMGALDEYRQALLDVAGAHVETVMPYYTHGQQAQPTTLAHHLHAFACAAERDFRRLEGAYETVDISQAGAAAGTATRFPVSRERVAALLGFGAVSTNTRDSSSNQDYLWEAGAALSLLGASLGFLADELILWCGQEYQLIRFADRWCHTSSIMTQKRNPTAAEAVQGVRKSLGGRTPVSYTGPEARAAMGEAIRALRLMAGILTTMTVDVGQMRRRTGTYWSQASDLAAFLVQERGLNWRMAHQTVGIMVRLAEEEGVEPERATPELLDRAAVLFLGRPVGLSGEEIARALDATHCVQTRTATGSPGPDEMRRQIAASLERLAADRGRAAARRARLEEADRALEGAVRSIAAT
jgi:argininosuccinate lyase